MRKAGSKCRRTRSSLIIGTWNVCTWVENSGDKNICRKGPVAVTTGSEDSRMVDRKLDLLVGELERYPVSVAGTKWFESDVWPAGDGCTFLH